MTTGQSPNPNPNPNLSLNRVLDSYLHDIIELDISKKILLEF